MGTLLPLATQTPGRGSQTVSTYPTAGMFVYLFLSRIESKAMEHGWLQQIL